MVHAIWEKAEDINKSQPLHRYNAEKIYDECPIVTASNTSAEPLAMVIESVDAVSTKVAMESALRPEYLTGMAELQTWHMSSSCTDDQWMNSTTGLFASSLSQILYGSCP